MTSSLTVAGDYVCNVPAHFTGGEAEARTVKSVKSLSCSRNEQLIQLNLNRHKLTKTSKFVSLGSKDLRH